MKMCPLATAKSRKIPYCPISTLPLNRERRWESEEPVPKSTLVQLIPRLYDVQSGRILLGGVDVRDYPFKELRGSVAMVLQHNVLFSGTIKENLKWGNEEATEEEIVEACKAAPAQDFISSFPDGYDTLLGQGGVNLSGGQKQRLCIARALLKSQRSSSWTTAPAPWIRIRTARSLGPVGKTFRTTTIIIAQRIASVMNADKIVVMEEGRIDAVGTHEELLTTNLIYREVYESQQKEAV